MVTIECNIYLALRAKNGLNLIIGVSGRNWEVRKSEDEILKDTDCRVWLSTKLLFKLDIEN